MTDLVTQAEYARRTGKTYKALERMRERGVVVEGIHYHRAPDGSIWFSVWEMERSTSTPKTRSIWTWLVSGSPAEP